ncbi:hypothetical protein GCM10007086_21580 [Photobacterium aphoticum]|nr:hypothetical protein GCM10007086_21580 [Photobacterium aphoticum]
MPAFIGVFYSVALHHLNSANYTESTVLVMALVLSNRILLLDLRHLEGENTANDMPSAARAEIQFGLAL